MILTCPNCASRFLLSAQVLAPEGRTVKCSSCGETWFELPDPDELVDNLEAEIEEIPEAVKPIPEGSSVPALAEAAEEEEGSRSAAIAGYIGALLVFVLVLGALLAFKPALLKSWPPSVALYELIGMEAKAPGEGLVFDRVKAEITPTRRMIIEGHIINLTNQDQLLPVIEVSVRDQAGQEIKQLTIQPPFSEMKAESTLPFKTSYKGEDGLSAADHVQLRFVLGKASPPPQQVDEAKDEHAEDDHVQEAHH